MITIVSIILITIALIGIATTRNLLRILMGAEIILNAANMNFAYNSAKLSNIDGDIFILFTLIVTAAEVALGLAIILLIYKNFNTVDIKEIGRERRY